MIKAFMNSKKNLVYILGSWVSIFFLFFKVYVCFYNEELIMWMRIGVKVKVILFKRVECLY